METIIRYVLANLTHPTFPQQYPWLSPTSTLGSSLGTSSLLPPLTGSLTALDHSQSGRCSRGIGLGLTKQLLESPSNFIIATCRDPSKAIALDELQNTAKGTLQVIRLDVDVQESMLQSVEEVSTLVGERGLDYLVNNAAIVSDIIASHLAFLHFLLTGVGRIKR